MDFGNKEVDKLVRESFERLTLKLSSFNSSATAMLPI
jgi:hypothetical protein